MKAECGTAVLDRNGVYLEIDEEARAMLGSPSPGEVSFARVPAGTDIDEVWWLELRTEVTPAPLVCRLIRDETGDRWRLSVTPAAESRAAVREYAERTLDAIGLPDRDAVVRALTEEFGRMCGLQGNVVVLIDEESAEPTFAGGIARQMLAGMQECRRRGAPMVIWQAFQENRVVVKRSWLRDVMRDPRLAPIRRFAGAGADPQWSFVVVPLALGGRRLGVVGGMLFDPESITPEQVTLWCDTAHQTALALGYAEQMRLARTDGADRERQRLNEDLHDTVGQDVFALKMLAARAEADAVRTGAPETTSQAHELRALSDQVSSGIRALIGERRRVGQALRLSQQLAGLAREMGSRCGVDIRASVGAEWDHLSAECRETVVRIVQEALRNIEKHAHARSASLRVVEDNAAPGMLLIEVVDDGESFDPYATSSASFGLTSIRERAVRQGGSVEIRSAPSTTLRVRLRPDFETEWDAATRRD